MRAVNMVAILVMLGALAACNTVAGVGQDLKRGGEAISNAAK